MAPTAVDDSSDHLAPAMHAMLFQVAARFFGPASNVGPEKRDPGFVDPDKIKCEEAWVSQ